MRKRQRLPALEPESEVDEYAEVRIPFDDVLRKLMTAPPPVRKPVAKKAAAPKKR